MSTTLEQSETTPDSPREPSYWARAGMTLLWAAAAFIVAQVVVTAIVLFWFGDLLLGSPNPTFNGPLVALVTLIGNPLQIALLAAVAWWRSGGHAADYLGIRTFSARDFLIGFFVLAVLVATIDGASYLARIDVVPTFEIDTWKTAHAGNWLWPLIAAVVVVGPAGEEITFRGFLFRGWVTPDWRGIAAVLVITLIWSALHIQYDLFGISQVFLTGLVLGWIRWRSGSTVLTTVLHMLVNLGATVETILKVGWAG